MEAVRNNSERDSPELLIRGLVRKLSHHALWDVVLVFLPPLAAIFYCLSYLFLKAWISPLVALVAGIAALVIGTLAIIIRYRPKIPSIRSAASLIDDRAGAKDRFLTLATLPSSKANSSMFSRLRVEAAGLQSRIVIRREFPYRINRHMYASLVVSVAVALLFQILLPLAHSKLRPQPAHVRLRELAEQMAMRPRLHETGLSLQALAAKLEEPKLPRQEKQILAQEEHKKIAAQMKKDTQKQDRELLSQAAGTLQELEQQSGDGERKKDQDGGGGGIQSNLPQKGKQQGNEGGGGESKGELNAQLNDDMQQGKLAQGNTKEQDRENNAGGKNGAQENQRDPSKPEKDKNQERTGRSEGGNAEGVGRSKAADDIPKGSPPVERFYKPGEGESQGIKDAGYVTVQLPEELAPDGKGGGNKRDSKGKKAPSSQVSVSNVPLPKHLPDAPSEKQQMPLEYRGIIR